MEVFEKTHFKYAAKAFKIRRTSYMFKNYSRNHIYQLRNQIFQRRTDMQNGGSLMTNFSSYAF